MVIGIICSQLVFLLDISINLYSTKIIFSVPNNMNYRHQRRVISVYYFSSNITLEIGLFFSDSSVVNIWSLSCSRPVLFSSCPISLYL